MRNGARGRDFEFAIEWLAQAGLVYRVFHISIPKIPLEAYADKKIFKLYLLNVGLLAAMSQLPTNLVTEETTLYQEFKGAFFENMTAQALSCQPGRQLYYWTSNGSAEIDFIIQSGLKVYPLEVKAGASKHKKSLVAYSNKYHPDYISRTSLLNLMHDNHFVNLPHYLAFRFPLPPTTEGSAEA